MTVFAPLLVMSGGQLTGNVIGVDTECLIQLIGGGGRGLLLYKLVLIAWNLGNELTLTHFKTCIMKSTSYDDVCITFAL